MANSNSEHSKKLRANTSRKYSDENYKKITLLFNKNKERDLILYEKLKNMSKERKNILYKLLIID